MTVSMRVMSAGDGYKYLLRTIAAADGDPSLATPLTTENTAKWWQNHFTHGATFQAGQLVIIDKVSLAGTLSLDRITGLAAEAGAKVLLVGDYGQLQSVDAGGAFGMLVADRDGDAPELTWYTGSSTSRRRPPRWTCGTARTRVIGTYLAHDRIADGDAEDMIDAACTAWRADRDVGRGSVLIAGRSMKGHRQKKLLTM